MSISNYGELKTAIEGFALRSTTLDSVMDTLTIAFESWANRNIRIPQMITSDETLAVSSRFTALPADFLEMERVVLSSGGQRYLLEYVTGEAAAALDDSTAGGTPRAFSIRGTDIELVQAPSSATLLISYYVKLDTITSSDAATNALLTNFPDIYLYGVLKEAALYMQDGKRMQTFGTRFTQSIDELKRYNRRHRVGVHGGMARAL